MMTDDIELVRDYVARQSEGAFETLVSRYVNLVYSSALRQVCDSHLAEEVTQVVFIILARKAGSLGPKTILPSWLHRTACYAAADALKRHRRRAIREQKALMQSLLNEPQSETAEAWARIAPLLDTAIAGLNEKERQVIVLRFFENRSLNEVGQVVGANENAARMRVNRALEKLRRFFLKRGLAATTTLIAGAISTNAVQAAPPLLTKSITATVLATGAAGGSTLTLGALKFMAWTKVKTVILGAIVIAGAATSLVIQRQAQARARDLDESVRQQSDLLTQLRSENERLSNLLAQAGHSQENDLDALARLRSEAEQLRARTNDLAALAEENRRLIARRAAPANNLRTAFELKEEGREKGITRMNFTREWVMAFRLFAARNQDQFPTSFGEALDFVPARAKTETNLAVEQFEIVYQGSFSSITNPSATIVIREKEAWPRGDGGWAKAYGFADGHSEIHGFADSNFEPWEKQRIIPAPGAQ